MATVEISVHGRAYTIACDDGQEARVSALGAALGERVREVFEAVPNARETQLLVLAAIATLDELEELRAELARRGAAAEDRALDQLTDRVEAIAGRLEQTYS